VEQAFGVETHYQLGLLMAHFQSVVEEDSLSPVSQDCYVLRQQAALPQYYYQTVEDDYLY